MSRQIVFQGRINPGRERRLDGMIPGSGKPFKLGMTAQPGAALDVIVSTEDNDLLVVVGAAPAASGPMNWIRRLLPEKN